MSESQKLRRIPLFAIILITVGLLLLADQLGMLDLTLWHFVTGCMILYGMSVVIRSFSTGDRKKIFWGTLLFLLGLYLLLDSLGLIPTQYPALIPAVFLMLGFSFLMSYLHNARDWLLLIPTLFFIGIGGLIIADERELLTAHTIVQYVRQYWPLLLILFGLGLILNSRRRV